jgi:hypothetical protein
MTDLKVIIAIRDPELEDEKLQEYTQNLLPQIREFDDVQEAGLVPRDQPVKVPGMTSKDFGAFLLGTVTVITTVKALVEIMDWVEKRWLKPSEDQPSRRKISIEVTTPNGYKLACTAERQEDLKAFLDEVIMQVG